MAGYYDRDRNTPGSTRTAAGTMNHSYAHHSSVSEYQSSGIPFAFSVRLADADFTEKSTNVYYDTVVTINLPYVSRWAMIWCHYGDNTGYASATQVNANDVRIGFGYNSTTAGTEGGPTNPAMTITTAGEGNWVSTGLANQQRLEMKTKQIKFVVPGYYAPSSSANANRKLTIEVLAGLTGAKEFPSTDAAYISGITSTDYDGAKDGTSTTIGFEIYNQNNNEDLSTSNGGL